MHDLQLNPTSKKDYLRQGDAQYSPQKVSAADDVIPNRREAAMDWKPKKCRLVRSDDRHIVRSTAWIHCRGMLQTAVLVDFSAKGLRLDETFGLASGYPVTIELTSGERLQGRVAWSVGSKIGVQLVPPLASNDPILLQLFGLVGKGEQFESSDQALEAVGPKPMP